MKKNVLLFSLLVGFLIIISMTRIIYKLSDRCQATVASEQHDSQEQQRDSQSYKIAVIVPLSHPALEEIAQGFLDTVLKVIHVSYDTYNGNGDRLLMRSQVEKVMRGGYDLVCALTTPIALMCKEVSQQRKATVPVVCCGVSEDPVEIGLIATMDSSRNNFVVISDHYDFEQQIAALLRLRSFRRILLPHYASPGLEKQVELLADVAKRHDIAVVPVKIYNIGELFIKIDALLGNSEEEVIMVLKDNVVVSGIESLVTLARRKQRTIYVSDLNSVDKGAVVGFGVSEYSIGVRGGEKALFILKDRKHPSDIASSFATDFIFKVNAAELNRQNLPIDETLLFLMSKTHVIGR